MVSGCTTALGSISGTSTNEGSWTDDCVSSNRRGTRYARYFTFELATAAELTIELVSEIDPYLYLMAGAGTSGTELAKNDDSRDFAFGYSDSRITYEAAAGTYTAEATTYPATSTGDFTIRIDAALKLPSAPQNVRVVPGNGRLVVLWDAPSSDGGSAITGYRVEQQASSGASGSSGSQTRSRRSIVDPSRLVGVDDRGYAILDLVNGTSYSVTVKAVNGNGDGAPATATATPQATTIMVTAPDTLEVGASVNVGVIVTDQVQGADYRVRLSIDDASKISFNGCSPRDDADILDSLSATATVHACSVGTANITAQLVVQDHAGGYHVVAASTKAIQGSTANLTISGLDGSAGTLNIGDDRMVTIEASNLATGVGYSLNVTTSDTAKLGFSSTCNRINAAREIRSTSGTMDDASFELHACVAVHRATVTATLSRDNTVVATATKYVNVIPAVPTNVRAIGHGESTTLGTVTIRVDKPDTPTDYLVRYKTCTASNNYCANRPNTWDRQNVFLSSTAKTFTVGGQTQSVHEVELANVTLGALYRVEVAAIVGGTSGVRSADYTNDHVLAFTTYRRPHVNASSEYPTIGTLAINGYWSSKTYQPIICTNTFPSNYVAHLDGALNAWKGLPKWTVDPATGDDHNIFTVATPAHRACPLRYTTGYPGTTEIRMAVSQHEFEAYCPADTVISPTTIGVVFGCVKKPGTAPTAGPVATLSQAYMFLRDRVRYGDWLSNANSSCVNKLHEITVHEAGHALGLFHSTIPEPLMNPSGGPCEPQPIDVAALAGLYQSGN